MVYFPKILALIIIHTIFSRAVSIPAGIFIFREWYVVVILVFIMDLIQIPFFSYLYEQPQKISFLSQIFKKLYLHLEQIQKKSLFKKSLRFHEWGVVLITALPSFGGGMWSGVLLAHLLKINKRKSYLLLGTGSLLSCIFLALGWGGIKSLFLMFWNRMDRML